MRKKLIELVGNLRRKITAWHTAEDIADMLIANGVTIPVRCKDCKFGEMCSIREAMALTDQNGYCCRGERKDNG